MSFFVSNKKSGFTLVEVAVAVGIVAVLSTVVIASVQEGRKKAHDAQRISDLQQVQVALRLYKDENDGYPTGPSGWEYSEGVEIGVGSSFDDLLAEYLSKSVKDPMGPVSFLNEFLLKTAHAGVSMDVNPYTYYYDSEFYCSLAPSIPRKVLFASTMELAKSSNWATICGDLPPGGVNSYGIILQ